MCDKMNTVLIMRKKTRKIIIISVIAGVFLLLLGLAAFVYFTATAQLTLSGDKTVTVEVFDEYSDPGAKGGLAFYNFSVPMPCSVEGKVDTDKVGEYSIKYSFSFLGKSASATRKVQVIDNVAPTIQVAEPNFTFNYSSVAPAPQDITVSATASDNYDGDLSGSITKTVENGICYYTVSDSSGNTATAKVHIIYTDGIKPTLTLAGHSTMYIAAGGSYIEPGYYAKDNLDGDITASVQIWGSIDTSKSGTYLREYTVTDGAGNRSSIARKVIVFGTLTHKDFSEIAPNGKTVYLTFDDGPGVYTQQLLDSLRQYNVKATFFVTNQFPKYQHLISSIHNDGHKVAVHTYSHQIYKKASSIYRSVDAYMADFYAMQDVVKAHTGDYTRIFRFPGGTNNLVSKSQCRGVMTALSQKLLAEGYYYFDWNVDSNDTRYGDAQRVITSTIDQISRKQNAVVLMHDIKKQTVEAVPAIIEYCLQNGCEFKVLTENYPAVRFKPAN